jgi:CheY-like chemotaxis protein
VATSIWIGLALAVSLGMSRKPLALVVDDESDLRHVVRTLLEHVGMDVVDVANGREALALLDERDFDLVMTDIQMPLMDGLELLRTIRLRPGAQPKVVVMSAQEQRAPEAMCAGAYEYIRKPFEIRHIMSVAMRAMQAAA